MKIIALVFLFLCNNALAATLIFEGYPTRKVAVYPAEVNTFKLKEAESTEFKVVIEKEGEKYYWRSRDNIEMTREVSGLFVTYLATNGAGYVRVYYDGITRHFKHDSYRYTEHVTFHLSSITYYGI